MLLEGGAQKGIDLDGDPPNVKRAKWEARRQLALSRVGAAGRAALDQERRGAMPKGQYQGWIDFLNAPYAEDPKTAKFRDEAKRLRRVP